MDYCKYHPLSPATYACYNCQTTNCDFCINDGMFEKRDRCFICEQEVESLGSINNIEPFWRRLQDSFRYPMNSSSISLIVGVSILNSITAYLPFAFLIYLALLGSILKYAFSCLKNTSEGLLIAPDISEAYGGGLGVAGRMILIIFIMIAVAIATNQVLGSVFGNIIGIFLIIGFPAVLINYALTEKISEAINPLNMIRLMTTIGLSYGLLLAFIMIMSASVEVISSIIGDNLSILSNVLQTIVFYYYLIVIFHIMGYMIFQYQGELGFVARSNNGDAQEQRNDQQILAAKIDVTIKEGFYDSACKLFSQAIKEYPRDKKLNNDYFEFLLAIKNPSQIIKFAPQYFDYLKRSNLHDRISIAYKQILKITPDYLPEKPELRLLLAKASHRDGSPVIAVKLLSGFYKQFPKFEKLLEVYQLLAECLDDLPNMSNKAEECRLLVEKLKRLKPTIKPVEQKATFYAPEEQFESKKPSEQEEKKPQSGWSKDLPPLDFN